MGGRGAGAVSGLDHRRGWARARALVACLIGVLIFALSAAAFVMIGFAAVARTWSWVTGTSFLDVPVWSWAPGGAGALGALAVVVSFLGTFWYFWRGASPAVLKEVQAKRLDLASAPVVANVVDALSLGIGKPAPSLYVTDDPAPNALSLRSRRSRVLVVTTGCAVLTRDELEALCAHELGHLWADDAHWVTSGMVALARARRFGSLILAVGVLLFGLVAGIAHYVDIFLWSAGLTGVALVVLGWVSKHTLRKLEFSVRCHADEIADVAAIELARNPASLGAVCARLASNPARVTHVGWRSELMWFEAAANPDVPAGDDRTVESSLLDRAVKAYATARVPLPPDVTSMLADSIR